MRRTWSGPGASQGTHEKKSLSERKIRPFQIREHNRGHYRVRAVPNTDLQTAYRRNLSITYASRGPGSQIHAAKAAEALETLPGADEGENTPSLGPAARATLRMLEWERLCWQVAKFASTTSGREEAKNLRIGLSSGDSRKLLSQTLAANVLEEEYAAELDFGGISTVEAASALRRAGRGGLLSGPQLAAVSGLAVGAARLRSSVNATVKRAEQSSQDLRMQPLQSVFRDLPSHNDLVSSIAEAVLEDGTVREDASEGLRQARARCRILEGRLSAILRGPLGEISQKAGKMCLAVPVGDSPPKGLVLGSGPGVVYVEPPAAVPLNNELAAARGEAAAAEEAVLWKLTGRVADGEDTLLHALDAVVWLDVALARARYGRWLHAHMPELVPWPREGKQRGRTSRSQPPSASSASAQARHDDNGDWEEEALGDGSEPRESDDQFLLRLRRLRHPLLWAQYLEEQEEKARTSGMGDGTRAAVRRLSNRRDVMFGNGSSQDAKEDEEKGGEEGELVPPVPVDICLRRDTRALIITGPNTGGKTATLKALGLAVLMAKAGLPVPAQEPVRLPFFSSVLADIGDEQSLSASLSTFSGHLRRIQELRRESDGKALVLLDEIGTGTEPTAGSALGIALLKAFVKGGARGAGFVMATTHHGALTSLKYEDPRFENASVEFDDVALAPTYRLLWGVPGRSNALNIASRLGLDPSVVQDARARLGSVQADVDDSIAELEALRKSAEAESASTEALSSRITTLRDSAAAMRRRMLEEQARQQLQQAEAAARLLNRAEKVVREALEQQRARERGGQPPQYSSQTALREAPTGRRSGGILQRASTASTGRSRAGSGSRSLSKLKAGAPTGPGTPALERSKVNSSKSKGAGPWTPQAGDTVFVPRLGSNAKVVARGKGGELTLQLGLLKLTANVNEVQAPTGQ
eukprot:jgi/Botrbrau1/17465/Bobra.0054s0052.1